MTLRSGFFSDRQFSETSRNESEGLLIEIREEVRDQNTGRLRLIGQVVLVIKNGFVKRMSFIAWRLDVVGSGLRAGKGPLTLEEMKGLHRLRSGGVEAKGPEGRMLLLTGL